MRTSAESGCRAEAIPAPEKTVAVVVAAQGLATAVMSKTLLIQTSDMARVRELLRVGAMALGICCPS